MCAMLLTPGHFAAAASEPLQWSRLPPLPDKLGVAGAFAGVSGGALVVAGGANFPRKMPWDGGAKVWGDAVYVLDQPEGRWRKAGRLPRPLGYGVSVTHRDSVVCVGGSDATRHHAEVFRLRARGRKFEIESMPPLPIPLANMSGALCGPCLHVAGGAEVPGETTASTRFFALDLEASNGAWRELEPIPGPPRFLAVAAASDETFFLFGGAALQATATGKPARVYLREALRYRAGSGWARLADLPHPVVAAPSPAPIAGGRILLLAGDDGSRAGFKPLDRHPGFPGSVLAYEPAQDRWSEAGRVPAPRATAPCVEWRGGFVVPSGEVRPGERSPEVWRLSAP